MEAAAFTRFVLQRLHGVGAASIVAPVDTLVCDGIGEAQQT